MRALRRFLSRISGLLPNPGRERELAAEIESHLQLHIDDNLRAGMTPAEARRQALLKLGGVQATKQAYRDTATVPVLEHLVQDVRFALRQLRKNPGFTATAILMLALGMCASVSIFAFVDAALIKPLPYKDPRRLVAVFETVEMFPRSNLSYPDYLDWKKLNHVFSSFDAFKRSGFLLSTASGAKPARGARVTDGFFRTLGVAPMLGRDFYRGEDLLSAPRTVLLSYSAWQNRYGGRPDALGQTVTLDGAPNVIVGVLPRDFHFPPLEPAEFWTTLHPAGSCDLRRSCHSLDGIARLKEGVSVSTAEAEMKGIAKSLERLYPDSNRDQGAAVAAMNEVIVGDVRPILLVLLGGAGLLLLIASVNVASLLLVRAESRRREIAVRHALGASASRVLSQFVTEGCLLVAAGTVLGLVSAQWAMRVLVTLVPADMRARMSYLQGLSLNGRVLVFAGVVALLAAALFSITPMLRLSLLEIRDGLAEGSRGSAGNAWRRLGSKMVVVELATAVVLLVGAALLGQSLYRLLRVDIGFQPDRLATLDAAAPAANYGKNEQAIELMRQVTTRLAALPGVRSVALVSQLPLSGNGNTTWFRIVGRPYHGEHNESPSRDVSAGYFQTVGAKLLRGRYFTEAEDAAKPHVVIINQALVRRYFPGEDPIGKQLAQISGNPPYQTIVGIVENIREGPLDIPVPPVVYVPFSQDPDRYFSVVVRTSQPEQTVLGSLSAAIRGIDSGIVTSPGAGMNQRISESSSAYMHRSSAWLVGGFAAVALLLSVVGLYGVIAYSVSQRTREIGVRIALGAQPGSVYSLILKEAGWLTAAGIAVGLLCSVAAAMSIRKLLFGVSTCDLPTLASVAVVLALAALLASFLPARRAASVSPLEALRTE